MKVARFDGLEYIANFWDVRCMRAHVYTHPRAHPPTHTYIHTHTLTHTHTHTQTHRRTHKSQMDGQTDVQIGRQIYRQTHMINVETGLCNFDCCQKLSFAGYTGPKRSSNVSVI